MASKMSCTHGTSSHTMVQCSSDTASKMLWGVTPRNSTALEPEMRLPNQCILAPVWYSGGMHRKVSSCV